MLRSSQFENIFKSWQFSKKNVCIFIFLLLLPMKWKENIIFLTLGFFSFFFLVEYGKYIFILVFSISCWLNAYSDPNNQWIKNRKLYLIRKNFCARAIHSSQQEENCKYWHLQCTQLPSMLNINIFISSVWLFFIYQWHIQVYYYCFGVASFIKYCLW